MYTSYTDEEDDGGVCMRACVSVCVCMWRGFHFISSNLFLSHLQSGFRTGHGLITATLKVFDDVIAAKDNEQVCLTARVDLANSVEHKILHSSSVLSSSCYNWFAAVSITIESSQQKHLSGSTWRLYPGPDLVLHDVAQANSASWIHLYADDTVSYSAKSALGSTLQLTSLLQRKLFI